MSFIEYKPSCWFPIQNLPYCAVKKSSGEIHLATVIGHFIVDLFELSEANLLPQSSASSLKEPTLNTFMGLGKAVWVETRAALTDLLAKDGKPDLRENEALRAKVFSPLKEAKFVLAARIGDYTDFYSSEYHATNVGKMFRPNEAALKPNWKHIPVGYHGRASSVVVSGTPIRRPSGQTIAPDATQPAFNKCRLMDFELEMAFWVGTGNELGTPISMEDASDKIFGISLMNDWSARDIQKWEYVPLGPFCGKNLGTTVSPFIVTMDALAPFAVPSPKQDPPVLPYLQQKDAKQYDVKLEVAIQPNAEGDKYVVCESNLKNLYWTMEQQLVHHSVTGCNMTPGDLCGSGTISGEEPSSFGSMLELCWKGTKEVPLGEGETRKFLKDGDNVVMSGYCQGDGYCIGLGECAGQVLPAF